MKSSTLYCGKVTGEPGFKVMSPSLSSPVELLLDIGAFRRQGLLAYEDLTVISLGETNGFARCNISQCPLSICRMTYNQRTELTAYRRTLTMYNRGERKALAASDNKLQV